MDGLVCEYACNKSVSSLWRMWKETGICKFRVNANGNRLDVWLIYRCKKCKHSWNLTIYERIRPSKIKQDDYKLFLENDYEFALKYGNDIGFLKILQRKNGRIFPCHLFVMENVRESKYKIRKLLDIIF